MRLWLVRARPAGTSPPVVFQEVSSYHHISGEMGDRKALYLAQINSYLSGLVVPY